MLLINKIDYVNFLLNDDGIDILFINETWLNNEVSDSELSIEGYSVIGLIDKMVEFVVVYYSILKILFHVTRL